MHLSLGTFENKDWLYLIQILSISTIPIAVVTTCKKWTPQVDTFRCPVDTFS